MARDHVDVIIEQWRRELRDLDASPVAVIGRISRLAQLIQAELEVVFSEYGLNGGEFDVLAALRRAGPPFRLTPSALGQSLMVTSGGMSKRLKALETAGLVTRPASTSDRRSSPVQLTPRGRRLVETVVVAHYDNERRLLDALTEDERAGLAEHLRAFLVSLGDAAPQPR